MSFEDQPTQRGTAAHHCGNGDLAYSLVHRLGSPYRIYAIGAMALFGGAYFNGNVKNHSRSHY